MPFSGPLPYGPPAISTGKGIHMSMRPEVRSCSRISLNNRPVFLLTVRTHITCWTWTASLRSALGNMLNVCSSPLPRSLPPGIPPESDLFYMPCFCLHLYFHIVHFLVGGIKKDAFAKLFGSEKTSMCETRISAAPRPELTILQRDVGSGVPILLVVAKGYRQSELDSPANCKGKWCSSGALVMLLEAQPQQSHRNRNLGALDPRKLCRSVYTFTQAFTHFLFIRPQTQLQ